MCTQYWVHGAIGIYSGFRALAFNNPPRQRQPKQQVSDAFSRQRQSLDQWQGPRGHGGVER